MKKQIRQQMTAGLILLHLVLPANVIIPAPIVEQSDNHIVDMEISNEGQIQDAARLVIDPPDDQLPLVDDGLQITTAAGLAEFYGIDISNLGEMLPNWLPTTDKNLFAAYVSLYNHTTPILYGPNGIYQTSGVDLGLMIARKNIAIDWEDKNLVNCGASGKACVDRNNPDPTIASTIYIVDIGYRPVNLIDIYAGRIAHEAYHLTYPYGKVNS